MANVKRLLRREKQFGLYSCCRLSLRSQQAPVRRVTTVFAPWGQTGRVLWCFWGRARVGPFVARDCSNSCSDQLRRKSPPLAHEDWTLHSGVNYYDYDDDDDDDDDEEEEEEEDDDILP